MGQLDPLGAAFAASLWDIKHFQDFKMASWKLKISVPFPIPIKWKDKSIGPLEAAFAASLRGIKHFQDFKKALKVGILKMSVPFPTPIKW